MMMTCQYHFRVQVVYLRSSNWLPSELIQRRKLSGIFELIVLPNCGSLSLLVKAPSVTDFRRSIILSSEWREAEVKTCSYTHQHFNGPWLLCHFVYYRGNVLCKHNALAFGGTETVDVTIVYLFPIEIGSYFLSNYGSQQAGNNLLFQYHRLLSYMNRINMVELCSETPRPQLGTKLNLSVRSKVTAISLMQGSLMPCDPLHNKFGIMETNETDRNSFYQCSYTKFFLNWYSGGWSPIASTRHCGH
jgi:hypothetical protein